MKKQHGFSSIEMLASAAITMVLLSGAMSMLNTSLDSSKKTSTSTDLEQNLRAGINLIVQDFISAGWGIPAGGIPIPAGSGAYPVRRPGPPSADLYFGSTLIAAVNPGAGLGPGENDQITDIVNILYADSLLPLNQKPLASIALDGSSATVDASTPISGITNPVSAGDLIAFSNAKGTTVQCVTRVDRQVMYFATNDPFNLNQRSASQGSLQQLRSDNGDGDLDNHDGPFPPTTATRVWLVTFYLDFTTNPQMPRLVRRINFNDGEPVALVLNNLQLTYDLADGITNPTNVDTPTSPNSPNQIRKANILISGRSGIELNNSGEYLQKSLTTQISLRSLSFVDRYQ
jgi:type II secretory pathway pseudopilin PulG